MNRQTAQRSRIHTETFYNLSAVFSENTDSRQYLWGEGGCFCQYLTKAGKLGQTFKKICFRCSSVYEKLFETSDIMSDAFELCVGHFHFMLDNFLFNIKTLDSVIKNSHIYAKIRDILTPTQTFGLLDKLTMCQTFCKTL